MLAQLLGVSMDLAMHHKVGYKISINRVLIICTIALNVAELVCHLLQISRYATHRIMIARLRV